MNRYCYVVMLSDGTKCYTRVVADGSGAVEERTWDEDNLVRLLQAGWRPVRETPMGTASGMYSYSLVVLERD